MWLHGSYNFQADKHTGVDRFARCPDLIHFLASTVLPVLMSCKHQHAEANNNSDCILTRNVEHLGVMKDRLEVEGGSSVSSSVSSISSGEHLSQEVVTIATFGSVIEGLLPGSNDLSQKALHLALQCSYLSVVLGWKEPENISESTALICFGLIVIFS